MANDVGVFFSFVFFLIGASYLASTKEWLAFYQSLAEKSYSGILIALFTLPAGLVILSFHNNWALDFPIFVTLMGWGMMIKGVVYLLFPSLPQKWIPKQKKLARNLATAGAFLMVFSALSGLSYYW